MNISTIKVDATDNPFTDQAMTDTYSQLSATDDTIDQQLQTVKTKWLSKLVDYLKHHCPKPLLDPVSEQLDANYQSLIADFDGPDTKTDYLDYRLLKKLTGQLIISDGIHQFEGDLVDQAGQITSMAELIWYLNWNFELMKLHQHWYYRADSPYYYSVTYSLGKLFLQKWDNKYATNHQIDDIREGVELYDDNKIRTEYQSYVSYLQNVKWYHNDDSIEYQAIK